MDLDKRTVSSFNTWHRFASFSREEPMGVDDPTPVSQITKLTLLSVVAIVDGSVNPAKNSAFIVTKKDE
jgi:hypothetical protein